MPTQTDPATATATIRKAAAAMREIASGVTTVGHDWTVHPPEGDTEWTIGAGSVRVAETPDYGQFHLPDHIASWTPPVALLVADLLDVLAADIASILDDHGGAWFGTVPAEWNAAYNLAIAYLEKDPRR